MFLTHSYLNSCGFYANLSILIKHLVKMLLFQQPFIGAVSEQLTDWQQMHKGVYTSLNPVDCVSNATFSSAYVWVFLFLDEPIILEFLLFFYF